MSDMYIARLARVIPPRKGQVRAFNVSNVCNVQELDNDLFQFAPTGSASPLGANVVGRPGNYGKALLRIQAFGNDIWVQTNTSNAITTNSASTIGNNVQNVGAHITANQQADFEIDPSVDLFLGAVTQSGTSNTATCTYWIVSFPLNYR